MNLKYNQINVTIDNYNILADSVDISQTSSQKPIIPLNNNNTYDYIPTNLKGTISFSYYLEPGNDPCYNLITGIISDSSSIRNSKINIGDVYITGYINNYSIQILPNSLLKVNSSFELFNPLTGILSAQNTGDILLYNLSNTSGLSHYWSTKFMSGNNIILDNNILQGDYSVAINQTPVYSLGNPYPTQVYINSINQSLSLLVEQQYNVNFSGNILNNIFPSLQNINIKNISTEWSTGLSNNITIPCTGMILSDFKCSPKIDEIIFFTIGFNKYN